MRIVYRVRHKHWNNGPFTVANRYARDTETPRERHYRFYNAFREWIWRIIEESGVEFPPVMPSNEFCFKVNSDIEDCLYAFNTLPDLVECFGPVLKPLKRFGFEICVISVPDGYWEQNKKDGRQIIFVENAGKTLFSFSPLPPYPAVPLFPHHSSQAASLSSRFLSRTFNTPKYTFKEFHRRNPDFWQDIT